MKTADGEKDTFVFPKKPVPTPTTTETRPTTGTVPTTTTTNTPTTVTPPQPTTPIDTITIKIDLPKKIVEGTTLSYQVIGVSKTGVEQDITKIVRVKVLGGIGKIVSPGKFLADIDADKKELGTVYGALSGEWVDSATGKTIPFGTKVFPVELYFEPVTDTRG